MSSRSFLFLFLCFFLILWSIAAEAAEEPQQKILYLSAANGPVNWGDVESFSEGSWSVEPVILKDFGKTMREGGFQAALDLFEDKLKLLIRLLNPTIVVVASKGLNILTHLANTGIYNGPAILLSPIPNECDHIHGNDWIDQWTDSMKVLRDKVVGPIEIGIGDSLDEQSLILEMMNETLVCGETFHKAEGQIGFRNCPTWHLRSYPGDHGWKNRKSNAINIASLINNVLSSIKKDGRNRNNEL